MAYRSILIPLDSEPECAVRTATVLALAQVMNSHVTGVAPTELLDMRASLQAASSVAYLPSLGRAAVIEEATRAALGFEVACEIAGVASRQSLVEETTMSVALERRVRVNDLTVLTQSKPPSDSHQAFDNSQIEAILCASARPVLILPYANAVQTLGTHVLVAWDDSRAAARAVADALPLLRRARHVKVLAFNRASATSDDVGLSDDLTSLIEWLQRQGVTAEASVERTEIAIADALLSRASDLGIDLIVMGAYGHSRWTERLLGGATRSMLATMTVPVLMSH
jgi:nucleotide-binding universal stress UspA family protein